MICSGSVNMPDEGVFGFLDQLISADRGRGEDIRFQVYVFLHSFGNGEIIWHFVPFSIDFELLRHPLTFLFLFGGKSLIDTLWLAVFRDGMAVDQYGPCAIFVLLKIGRAHV